MPVTEYFLLHGLFMSLLLQHRLHSGIVSSLGVSNPVVFVAAFVGVQGLIEAGFCFVVGSIVSKHFLCTETCIIFKRTAVYQTTLTTLSL